MNKKLSLVVVTVLLSSPAFAQSEKDLGEALKSAGGAGASAPEGPGDEGSAGAGPPTRAVGSGSAAGVDRGSAERATLGWK